MSELTEEHIGQMIQVRDQDPMTPLDQWQTLQEVCES